MLLVDPPRNSGDVSAKQLACQVGDHSSQRGVAPQPGAGQTGRLVAILAQVEALPLTKWFNRPLMR